MDFLEKLQFVAQNAINGVHWNNVQCTIFIVVYYYKDGKDLKHGSMIIISNELNHNTASVHTFQGIIINRLKELLNNVSKVIYFTDGAVQHFKNIYTFKNLQFHSDDFGFSAKHHYFATAHGNGPGDGVGGNFKK